MKDRPEFEILPDTGDLRLRVQGETLREVFRAALRGVALYLKPDAAKAGGSAKVMQPIAIKAVDINSLLVEFLSEAVAQTDIRNTIFTQATFRTFGENFLEGELAGTAVEELERSIRGVSYHDVDIKKNPDTGLFEAVLVFNI